MATLWLMWGTERAALPEGDTVLGRDSTAGILFDAPGVSRRHARIIVSEREATLEDLGSKNGTYLRGQRLSGPVKLADGDEFHLGPVKVTFRMVAGTTGTVTVEDCGSVRQQTNG